MIASETSSGAGRFYLRKVRHHPSFSLPVIEAGPSILKEQKSIKLTPEEPREDMEIKAQSLPSHRHLMAQRCAISESHRPEPSQCSRESRANSSPERSLTGSICHPVYDNKLTSQTPGEKSSPHRLGEGSLCFSNLELTGKGGLICGLGSVCPTL